MAIPAVRHNELPILLLRGVILPSQLPFDIRLGNWHAPFTFRLRLAEPLTRETHYRTVQIRNDPEVIVMVHTVIDRMHPISIQPQQGELLHC
jgi:hypothetical protein